MTAVLCGVNRRQFAGQRGGRSGHRQGQAAVYGWPGLAVRQQLAFTYPCALAFLAGTGTIAIGS